MSYSILRTKKHSSIGTLRSRQAHTFRTRLTPNADPKKFKYNKMLFGREDYSQYFEEKLKIYSEKNHIRADAVLAIEYLLTASPEFFFAGTISDRQEKLDAWCEAQINFLKEMHGEENILCAYLHMDEKTPHIEAFILPIDKKNRLNCKNFLGGSKKLSELQTNYAKHNEHLGLTRGVAGSRATHQKVKNFYSLINQKSEINNANLTLALKLDKPNIFDKFKIDDYIASQEAKLHKNMTEMFARVVQKAKFVEKAEKLIANDEKREKRMNEEKLILENTIKQMKKEAQLMLAPMRMVEILQEENANLLKTIEWQQEKIDAQNIKQSKNLKPD